MMHVRESERPACVTELNKEWGPETTAAAMVDVDDCIVAAKSFVSRSQIERRLYALGDSMSTREEGPMLELDGEALGALEVDPRPCSCAGDGEGFGLLRSRFNMLGERLSVKSFHFFFNVLGMISGSV
jgi:hypothetical protein